MNTIIKIWYKVLSAWLLQTPNDQGLHSIGFSSHKDRLAGLLGFNQAVSWLDFHNATNSWVSHVLYIISQAFNIFFQFCNIH